MYINNINKDLELKRKLDNRWGFANEYIYVPIAIYIVLKIYKYKFITPNKITIFGFICALISSALLSLGEYMFLLSGIILANVFLITDCIDGRLARINNMESKIGKVLDDVLGFLSMKLIYIGLLIGLLKIYYLANPLVCYMMILLILGNSMISFDWNQFFLQKKKTGQLNNAKHGPLASKMERLIFKYSKGKIKIPARAIEFGNDTQILLLTFAIIFLLVSEIIFILILFIVAIISNIYWIIRFVRIINLYLKIP